jgi:hypothetical protein
MAGQRGRHSGKEPHLQEDDDDGLIEGCMAIFITDTSQTYL